MAATALDEAEFCPEDAQGARYHLRPAGAALAAHAPLYRLQSAHPNGPARVVAYLDLRHARPAPAVGAAELPDRPLEVVQYDRRDGLAQRPGQPWAHLSLWQPRNLPPEARPLLPTEAPGDWLPGPADFERLLLALCGHLEDNLAQTLAPPVNLAGGAVWVTPRRLFLLDAGHFRPVAAAAGPPRHARYGEGAWGLLHVYLALHLRRLALGDGAEQALPAALRGPRTLARFRQALEAGALRLDEEALGLRRRVIRLAGRLDPARPDSPDAAMSRLEAGVPALQGDLVAVRDAVRRAQQAWTGAEARLKEAGEEVERLRGQLSLTNQGHTEARQKLSEAREKLTRAQQEAGKLRDANARLENTLRHERATVAKLEGQLAETRSRAAEWQNHAKRLHADAGEAREELAGHLRAVERQAACGVAARGLALALDLALLAAPALFVDVTRLAPEALVLIAACVLFARAFASPGRALLGLSLVRLGRNGRCALAGGGVRFASGLLHYGPVIALAGWALVEARAGRSPVEALLGGALGPAEWGLLAGGAWLLLLVLTALASPLMPLAPLYRATTCLEWPLRLGAQRFRYDRLQPEETCP